ncbi:hypothetical protein AGMMS50255_8210 [Spirochaetia bacterium]|nr:hypothetical protein AGMMS50255_8210 [Spirochaetia bacterium]
MKKNPVLWLLPLAAALFIYSPSALFAGGKKDRAVTTAPAVPATIKDETVVVPPIPSEPLAVQPEKAPAVAPEAVTSGASILSTPGSSYPSFTAPADRERAEGNTAIPLWVLEPDADLQDKFVIGIGSAKSSTDQLSIQMAEARARQDIAFQLDVQVKARITDYAENEGKGNVVGKEEYDFSQDSVTERIGEQLTNIDLKGVRVAKREKDANTGAWWVQVLWSKPQADKAAADIAQNVIAAEVGPGPAERARQAAKRMDEQLERAQLKPDVVSEPSATVSE